MKLRPVLALALVVALAACGSGEPDTADTPVETAVETAAPTVGDVATEAPPTEEVAESPTIPGLVAANIYGNLENRGFTCERDSTSEGFVATCRDAQGNDAIARGTGPTGISLVTATALGTGGDEESGAFLGFVASVPYDGAEPDSATAWVEENVGKNAETVFGGAKFRLIAAEGGTARILEITPAE